MKDTIRGRALARLAVMAGALVLAVGVAEIALRVTASKVAPVYRPSHLLGWEHVQGGRYNNHGLAMDRDVAYERKGGRRILLLGDSFLDDTVTWKMLERGLNERFPGETWEIINGGVSGYSPDQYRLWWKIYGRNYKPDIVMTFLFVGNDWADIAKQRKNGGIAKPYYMPESGALSLHQYPIAEPEVKTVDEWSPLIRAELGEWLDARSSAPSGGLMYRAAYSIHRWLRDNSRLYVIVKNALSGSVSDATRYAASDWLFYRNYAVIFSKRGGLDLDRIWDLQERIIAEFVAEVRSDGAEPLFVLIPHIWQIDASAGERFTRGCAEMNETIDLSAPNVRMRELAARHSLKWIDLYDRFKAEHSSDTYLFDGAGSECHWNNVGRALAIEEICGLIDRDAPVPK